MGLWHAHTKTQSIISLVEISSRKLAAKAYFRTLWKPCPSVDKISISDRDVPQIRFPGGDVCRRLAIGIISGNEWGVEERGNQGPRMIYNAGDAFNATRESPRDSFESVISSPRPTDCKIFHCLCSLGYIIVVSHGSQNTTTAIMTK
jgi:hypothetical protein